MASKHNDSKPQSVPFNLHALVKIKFWKNTSTILTPAASKISSTYRFRTLIPAAGAPGTWVLPPFPLTLG